MTRGIENILFTSFIGLVIIVALFISLDWPVRASIVILLLGSIGIVLTVIQLALDLKILRRGDRKRRPADFRGCSARTSGPLGKPGNLGLALGTFLRDPSYRHAHRASAVCFPLHQTLRRELDHSAYPRGCHLGISLRRIRAAAPRPVAETLARVPTPAIVRAPAAKRHGKVKSNAGYFVCFERVYGPASKALSGGSLVAPPTALTISYIRFSEAMSCGSKLAI